MDESVAYFSAEIRRAVPSLSQDKIVLAARFAESLYRENKIQNLTRITAADFVSANLIDVVELLKLESLGNQVLDIGSGCGVPGLLAAAIDTDSSRKWILVESEKKKAVFLQRVAEELNLIHTVSVIPERVEDIISSVGPTAVIARAVGPAEKIASWIWNCSTWNNLILFKSVGWEAEWLAASKTKYGKKLTISQTHKYDADGKNRVLVSLKKI